MAGPPFGTASAYADAFPAPPPKTLTLGAETCFNLTVFRDLVRQYRKLDDQVVTRLNRAQAQLRDEARVGKGSGNEGMCAQMWGEVMAGWAHRQTLITYCQNTVESSAAAKHAGESAPAPHRGALEEQRIAEQLGSEAMIEAIIRKRTLDVFRQRCPFFAPTTDAGRVWWELADGGRPGAGPSV
ncbi:hypothetical protein CC85DRAFT_283889 [Cutaneotrichosporon oleaginosum]|uniref:Caffeine-induced death protein 2 n=1 Tax=Cutaneotrichosporon oleaginosum TaxID=879819 RepID=A0A0J0XSN6_9TREE|nr:uncharacterized protein CC85DRAFT_283889 [Cutaneotrichosporon oleaginosum]KLT44111.1 hypothetical protein CC85DRAFT_283889 [Cutaneotrichosporon oleaginosum]TXT09434.1 hypothetical protein COLE_03368 [Cutaneotrichosporon oleaginosum]